MAHYTDRTRIVVCAVNAVGWDFGDVVHILFYSWENRNIRYDFEVMVGGMLSEKILCGLKSNVN